MNKHERNYIFLDFVSRSSQVNSSVKRSGGKQKASSRIRRKRTGWRVASRRHCNSRERNWHSRLNGNRRWFVRQSSFSGFARRSFSRQLQGEKGRPLFPGLPTRFFYLLNALLYILALSYFTLISLIVPQYYSTYGRTRRTPSPSHAKKASGIVFKILFPR